MPAVNLSDAEWQQVMGMISLAPWRDANPLLLKIGQQLQALDVQRQDVPHQQPLNGPHKEAPQ